MFWVFAALVLLSGSLIEGLTKNGIGNFHSECKTTANNTLPKYTSNTTVCGVNGTRPPVLVTIDQQKHQIIVGQTEWVVGYNGDNSVCNFTNLYYKLNEQDYNSIEWKWLPNVTLSECKPGGIEINTESRLAKPKQASKFLSTQPTTDVCFKGTLKVKKTNGPFNMLDTLTNSHRAIIFSGVSYVDLYIFFVNKLNYTLDVINNTKNKIDLNKLVNFSQCISNSTCTRYETSEMYVTTAVRHESRNDFIIADCTGELSQLYNQQQQLLTLNYDQDLIPNKYSVTINKKSTMTETWKNFPGYAAEAITRFINSGSTSLGYLVKYVNAVYEYECHPQEKMVQPLCPSSQSCCLTNGLYSQDVNDVLKHLRVAKKARKFISATFSTIDSLTKSQTDFCETQRVFLKKAHSVYADGKPFMSDVVHTTIYNLMLDQLKDSPPTTKFNLEKEFTSFITADSFLRYDKNNRYISESKLWNNNDWAPQVVDHLMAYYALQPQPLSNETIVLLHRIAHTICASVTASQLDTGEFITCNLVANRPSFTPVSFNRFLFPNSSIIENNFENILIKLPIGYVSTVSGSIPFDLFTPSKLTTPGFCLLADNIGVNCHTHPRAASKPITVIHSDDITSVDFTPEGYLVLSTTPIMCTCNTQSYKSGKMYIKHVPVTCVGHCITDSDNEPGKDLSPNRLFVNKHYPYTLNIYGHPTFGSQQAFNKMIPGFLFDEHGSADKIKGVWYGIYSPEFNTCKTDVPIAKPELAPQTNTPVIIKKHNAFYKIDKTKLFAHEVKQVDINLIMLNDCEFQPDWLKIDCLLMACDNETKCQTYMKDMCLTTRHTKDNMLKYAMNVQDSYNGYIDVLKSFMGHIPKYTLLNNILANTDQVVITEAFQDVDSKDLFNPAQLVGKDDTHNITFDALDNVNTQTDNAASALKHFPKFLINQYEQSSDVFSPSEAIYNGIGQQFAAAFLSVTSHITNLLSN
ncbi:hypothetical protein, partial [Salmonella enterica]|uniref:hypothetical protein n=1 Tax=Salmonella enterica TaxID=28901 RepID=UPI0011BE79FB